MPIFESVGQPSPVDRARRSPWRTGRGVQTAEAFAHRGVDRHPFGQGDDGLLESRLGDAVGVGQTFVGEVDVEVKAGRRSRPDWSSAWVSIVGAKPSLPQPVIPRGFGGIESSWVSAKPYPAGSLRSGSPSGRKGPGPARRSAS